MDRMTGNQKVKGNEPKAKLTGARESRMERYFTAVPDGAMTRFRVDIRPGEWHLCTPRCIYLVRAWLCELKSGLIACWGQ
jgi:hypothetical protein